MNFSLSGKFLVASPTTSDPHFSKAVVFVCGHDEQGAMGIVINRKMETLSFFDLLENLSFDLSASTVDPDLFFGGPVDISRGFVIHTADYVIDTSMAISGSDLYMTATIEILRAISEGEGPEKFLIALGYAGWEVGQLEQEIQENSWLVADLEAGLLFDCEPDHKWSQSMISMGIRSSDLSCVIGHA